MGRCIFGMLSVVEVSGALYGIALPQALAAFNQEGGGGEGRCRNFSEKRNKGNAGRTNETRSTERRC